MKRDLIGEAAAFNYAVMDGDDATRRRRVEFLGARVSGHRDSHVNWLDGCLLWAAGVGFARIELDLGGGEPVWSPLDAPRETRFGEPVFTVPVHDEAGGIVDILALGSTDPDAQVWRRTGFAQTLGHEALRRAFDDGTPLRIHRSVRAWLGAWPAYCAAENAKRERANFYAPGTGLAPRFGEQGLCIVDPAVDLERLLWGLEAPIICDGDAAGIALAREVDRQMKAARQKRRRAEPALPVIGVMRREVPAAAE